MTLSDDANNDLTYDLQTLWNMTFLDYSLGVKKNILKAGKYMKKYGILSLMLICLLTGCSVEIDTGSSKEEQLATAAEELGLSFEETKETMELLKDQETLTAEDQKLIVKKLEQLIEEIEQFKDEDGTLIGKAAKKLAMNQLNKKEKILLNIREKAENETADISDIKKIMNTVSDDFEFSLFGS